MVGERSSRKGLGWELYASGNVGARNGGQKSSCLHAGDDRQATCSKSSKSARTPLWRRSSSCWPRSRRSCSSARGRQRVRQLVVVKLVVVRCAPHTRHHHPPSAQGLDDSTHLRYFLTARRHDARAPVWSHIVPESSHTSPHASHLTPRASHLTRSTPPAGWSRRRSPTATPSSPTSSPSAPRSCAVTLENARCSTRTSAPPRFKPRAPPAHTLHCDP